MFKTKMMISTLALLGCIGSAYADETTHSWSGCWVGVEGGAAAANTKVSFNDYYTVDGFGSTGGTLGAALGCDLQFNRAVVGIMGSYDWFNGLDSSIDSPYGNLARLELNSQWMIGGRVGYVIGQETLLYSLAGYTGLNTSDLSVFGNNFSMPDFRGYTVGGGLETALGKSLRLGLEYRYNKYGEESQEVYCDTLAFEPEVQTVRLTLKWVPLGGLFDQKEPVYAAPLK